MRKRLDPVRTLEGLSKWAKTASVADRGMYSFFEEEVRPDRAYMDTFLVSGERHRDQRFVEGTWERFPYIYVRVRMAGPVPNTAYLPCLQLFLGDRNNPKMTIDNPGFARENPKMVLMYNSKHGPVIQHANVDGKEEFNEAISIASDFSKRIDLYTQLELVEEQIKKLEVEKEKIFFQLQS